MKNLALAAERRRNVSLGDAVLGRCVVGMCQAEGDMDADAARFILTSDGVLAKIADDNHNGKTKTGDVLWMSPLDGLCENPGGEWFSLSYVDAADELSLACLSRNGAIVTVNPSTGEAELVGEFEHGLQAASFSPDGEVLCLLTFSEEEEEDNSANNENPAGTKNSALLLMNTQWEVLAETNIERHTPSGDSRDSAVSICWRPDGSLVALSTVDVADNLRKIRIFKRDNLQFDAIGRTEDGSGKLVPNMIASAGISWAGAGCSQLLAAAQRKGKKTIQIIFFEPNGNRHREFVLREDPTIEVLGLAWDVESDLLAVTLREPAEGGCDKVQLWYRSNYHWYMKQEFQYHGDRQVARVAFHEEKPGILYIFFKGIMEWYEYEVLWQPSQIQILSSKTCAAYVVDGSSLNMTALDQSMVPPPMYASSIALESPISQVLVSNDDTKAVTAIVRLSNGSMVLIGNPLIKRGTRRHFTTPKVVAKGHLKELDAIDFSRLRSFVIVEHTDSFIRLLAVCCAADNSRSESLAILTVTLNEDDQALSVKKNDNVVSLEQRVMCVAQWSDTMAGAILETEDGTVFSVETTGNGDCNLLPLDSQEFMEPCSWVAGLKNSSSLDAEPAAASPFNNDHNQNPLVFGLSQRSRLFYHDMLLADAVSSFFVSVSHQYLCYATAQGSTSQLRFLPFKDLQSFDTLMGSDGNIMLEGYEPRSVERGARLVAVLPGSPSAVIQVPRGNLEGVFPRALVLRFVMKKVASGDYSSAFAMMRKQKVNLNLIVDLNPRNFLEVGLELFLKQVSVIDHLNLFISCLQNWDCTQAQYKIPHWMMNLVPEADLEAKKYFDFSTKINQVCTKMRALMLAAECDGKLEGGKDIVEGHFLLPTLTTFAKEDPPKLEEALTLIKENAIVKSKQSNSRKPPMFSEAAQSSIQYLAFLADHELIFNVGLGLYDFDIARACARNSQMDPKVYLPLLKRLKAVPTNYGRYEVDIRLKRFENALRNLFESGQQEETLDGIEPVKLNDSVAPLSSVGNEFEHCMMLIENHRLHGVGLELYGKDPDKKRLIMLSLGENLLKESKADGALMVFLATEPVDIEQAKRAARACKDWKCFFTLSCQTEQNDHQTEKELRETAAREISEGIALTSENQYNCQNDFGDAARMLLDYCGDIDGAVDMLTKGWLWQEGCRISTLHGRMDLVQHCVEAAVSFAETMQSDLEERNSAFREANSKYEEALERRKEAIRSGVATEDQFAAAETGSLFSAASNASNLSLQSTTSTDSLSSVISIKSANSFSISGSEVDSRHRSKFNPMGGKKKKKKKKQGKKNRIQPGSPEELRVAFDALRGNCVNDDLSKVISQTLQFLSQIGREIELAKAFFKSYTDLSDAIQLSHTARADARKNSQLAELHQVPVHLPIEEEVSGLSCPKLADSLYDVFDLL